MKKEITVKELRTLPIGTMVTVHGHDKYGYPTTLECEIVQAIQGRRKELRYTDWAGDFQRMPIRMNKKYTIEEKEGD